MKIALAGMTTCESWEGGESEIIMSLIKAFEKKGIEYCRVDAEKERRKKGKILINELTLYNKYRKKFLEEKPDIVLGFSDHDHSYTLACNKSKIPLILTAHGYWLICPKNSLFDYNKRVCEKSNFAKCRLCTIKTRSKYAIWNSVVRYSNIRNFAKYYRVIVPSNCVKNILIKRGGYCEKNVKVVENGIDLSFWKYTPLEGLERRILFYSNFSEEKGLEYFIQLAKHFDEARIKFMVAGRPVMVNNLNIQKLGILKREEVVKAVQEAYIVVVPSIWDEPFGLVSAQAMAIGRPVVAFDSGGLSEQVIDGKTGFLIKRGDFKGLCEKVEILINDFNLAKKMGDEGRKRAEERYDQGGMVEKYIDFIQKELELIAIKKRR